MAQIMITLEQIKAVEAAAEDAEAAGPAARAAAWED